MRAREGRDEECECCRTIRVMGVRLVLRNATAADNLCAGCECPPRPRHGQTQASSRAVARRTGRRVAGHGGGGVGHGDAWRGGRDVWRVRRGHSAFRGSACVTSLRRMRFLHNRRKRPGGVTVRDALTQTRFCVGSALSERIAHHRVDIDRQTQMCYSLGVSVRGVAWDNSETSRSARSTSR